MDAIFLPWWLILLLGMWAVALTIWQLPTVNREVRLWMGLATLVYFGLIFTALTVGPQPTNSDSPSLPFFQFTNIGLVICMAIGLIAGTWLLGRAPWNSRCLAYVVLTLCHSGICVLLGCPEVAIGLFAIALVSAKTLIGGTSLAKMKSSGAGGVQLIQFMDEPVPPERQGEFWLIGVMTVLVSCILLGSISYALRYETSRTRQSDQRTALPARAQLNRLTVRPGGSVESQTLIDLATGERADVVVLMAVIAFLGLAIRLNTSKQITIAQSDSSGADSGCQEGVTP